MAINIPSIAANIAKETGQITQIYFRVIEALVSFANNSPVTLDYPGSPEGNLDGRYKDQCWDTLNSKLYFKSTATGDTGWIALN